MKTLLLVCTGNTCRSAMAGAIAKKLINETGLAGQYQVKSAGTAAFDGDYASENAIKVIAAMGLDLRQHRSAAITPQLIAEADLILVMTESHRRQVLSLVAAADEKTYLLKSFAESEGEITDPFGGGEEIYRRCALEIEQALEKAINRWLEN